MLQQRVGAQDQYILGYTHLRQPETDSCLAPHAVVLCDSLCCDTARKHKDSMMLSCCAAVVLSDCPVF